MLHRILTENADDSTVAVVTHGGMINQLYGTIMHTPVGKGAFICTSDTGIHIWSVTERGTYIVKANVDGHIAEI